MRHYASDLLGALHNTAASLRQAQDAAAHLDERTLAVRLGEYASEVTTLQQRTREALPPDYQPRRGGAYA